MIEVRLKEYLDTHNISPYQLGQAVKDLSPKTVYMYVNGERTPSLDGIDKVIQALHKLTNHKVKVNDLLIYKNDDTLTDIAALVNGMPAFRESLEIKGSALETLKVERNESRY